MRLLQAAYSLSPSWPWDAPAYPAMSASTATSRSGLPRTSRLPPPPQAPRPLGVGEQLDVTNDITVSVTDPVAQSAPASNYLQTIVHLAKNGRNASRTSTVPLLCANRAEQGEPFGRDGHMRARLPARPTMDAMMLLLPGGDRTGNAHVSCSEPAFIRVTPWTAVVSPHSESVRARIAVPTDVVTQLNQQL